MSDDRTITLYVTLTGEIWATSRDLKGGYAVKQDFGKLPYLLGHFGNIEPRSRVDTDYLADPEDIAGHPFAYIIYDAGKDQITLNLDAKIVNEFPVAGRFITGVHHLTKLEIA